MKTFFGTKPSVSVSFRYYCGPWGRESRVSAVSELDQESCRRARAHLHLEDKVGKNYEHETVARARRQKKQSLVGLKQPRICVKSAVLALHQGWSIWCDPPAIRVCSRP